MHHSDMVWEQVNQIGSVTESIEAVKMSKRAGWGVMASHRRFEVDLEYCRHGVFNCLHQTQYILYFILLQWRD